jgi:[ribosomal protein S5]-alanine N-acetyltransferase
MPFTPLFTHRLELRPITLPIVEAVMAGDRHGAERHVGAPLPESWPGTSLIERAFVASLEAIRADPERRLWGDRVMITRETTPRVVGSVVFHGAPDDDGIVEVAYGVEQSSQGNGYATEATRACVEWALEQPDVAAVRATTPPWHMASRRVLEKVGFVIVGTREHELLGELLGFERPSLRAPTRSASVMR